MKLVIGLVIGIVIGAVFGYYTAGIAMILYIEREFDMKDGRYGKHKDR